MCKIFTASEDRGYKHKKLYLYNSNAGEHDVSIKIMVNCLIFSIFFLKLWWQKGGL